MKNFLKSVFLFVLMCSLVLVSIAGHAANNSTKPLHEKYGYKEDYEYEEEIIAHALKSTVIMVRLNFSATVEYTPVTFDANTIIAYINKLYNEYSSQYSKEEISKVVIDDMNKNIAGYLEWGESKEIDVAAVGRGSGVVIDENGHIATNSHVVSLTDDQKLEACVQQLQSGIIEDLKKVKNDISKIGVTLSDEQIKELFELVVSETAEKARIKNEEEELFVCFPSSSGATDIDDSRTYEADVVKEGVSISISNDGTTQDAAILKINQNNLVALKLSDTYPEINSKIVSSGFPAVDDYIFTATGSDESALSITVGTGNITRQIPIKGYTYKALGISTTISGGSSGGPSVDENLNIEGLNTYSAVDDNRYAYMVPSEYVRELSKDIILNRGEVTLNFLTGLQMLQQDFGAAALECFQYVQTQRPQTPYIDSLIQLANKAPATYPEGSQESEFGIVHILIIAGCVLLVVVIIVVIIVVIKSSGRKKRAQQYQNNNGFGSYNNSQFGQGSGTGFGNSGSSNDSDIWKI